MTCYTFKTTATLSPPGIEQNQTDKKKKKNRREGNKIGRENTQTHSQGKKHRTPTLKQTNKIHRIRGEG
jgi:hypothetical protein